MATKTRSAGILLYRWAGDELEVLVVHMGGPFWHGKDAGAWSIPKGEYGEDEDAFVAACREFAEELGQPVPATEFADLGDVVQRSGKRVRVWAGAGDLDVDAVHSNLMTIEWPRGSGRYREFPEIDRAAWFSLAEARPKLITAQRAFLDRLAEREDPSGP